MKRFLFACLATLLCATTWAQNSGFDDPSNTSYFVVDGIYYYVSGSRVKQCTVTSLYHADLNEANVNTYKGDIVIPDVETITNPKNSTEYTIVSLFEDAFAYCSELTSISIPDNRSITTINSYCFYNCTGLTEITIPSTVTEINNYAFQGCSNLATVTCLNETPPQCHKNTNNVEDHLTFDGIPEDAVLYVPLGCVDAYQDDVIWGYYFTVKEIGDDKEPLADGDKFESDGIYYTVVSAENRRVEVTYYGDSYSSDEAIAHYTGDINIPRTVTYDDVTYLVVGLGDYAFYKSAITSISMPTSFEYFGTRSLYNCTNITSLDIPEGVLTIGDQALRQCTSMTTLNLPKTVTYLGEYLCWGNTALKAINIPSSVTTLGKYVFYNCSAATELTLSPNITEWGSHAFYDCEALTHVDIPEGITEVGEYAFSNCDELVSISIPDEVTTLGAHTFAACSKLESCVLPESMTEVDGYLFYNCPGMTEVTIGSKVESFGSNVFAGCPSLVTIYSLNPTPPTINSNTFSSTSLNGATDKETCVLYVPFEAGDAYKEADVWKEFYNIEELPDPVYHPTYDVIPEEGVVESLSVIELWSDILFLGNESGGYVYNGTVSVYKDGQDEAVTTSKSIEGDYIYPEAADHGVIITLNDEITEEGDYTVVIPAGLFYWYNDDDPILNDELTLYYTVQEKNTFVCDVDPADKKTISELSQVTFTNPNGGEILCNDDYSTYPEFNVYDEEGNLVTIMNNVTPVVENGLEVAQVLTFGYGDEDGNGYPSVVTEDGTYYVTVPAEIFIIYDEDGNILYNEGMTLTYIVSADATEEPNYTLVISPESGSTLESLSNISITCEDGIMWNTLGWADVAVYDGNGNELDNEVTWEEVASSTGSITEVDLTISLAITAAGDYTVVIPEGYFLISGTIESKAITLEYTISTSTGIGGISINDENVEGIYSTSGQKLNSTQKGVNIVRYNDGTVKKIYIK